jgi:hypothetical protein
MSSGDVALFSLFLLVSSGIGLSMSSRPGGMLQYPFLATTVMVGWVAPQFLGLMNSNMPPSGSLQKTIFFATLCLFAAWLGCRSTGRPYKAYDWEFSYSRLLYSSAALSLIGLYFYLKVAAMASEAMELYGGHWTGVITIYVLLSTLMLYGFAIAVAVHLRVASLLSYLILVMNLLIYFQRIVIHGRRAAMVELAGVALFYVWLKWGRTPPRSVIFIAVLLGSLVVNSIGDYRNLMMSSGTTLTWSGAGVSDILQINFLENLTTTMLRPGLYDNLELLNATHTIATIDETLELNYGFSAWNAFINAYVPGQLLGYDFKNALIFEFAVEPDYLDGYERYPGTTPTGFSDAFNSFWYFGAVIFFALSRIYTRWLRSANRGSLAATVIVMVVVSPSLHAITHTTHHFFLEFVKIGVVLTPIFLLCRRRRPRPLLQRSDPTTVQ